MSKLHYRKRTTLRRAAIIRELASLGRTQVQAAIVCDVSPNAIGRYCRLFDISLRRAPAGKPSWLKELIMRDYGKEGVTATVMAERYGSTPNSIAVRISQLRKAGLLPPTKGANMPRQLEAQP